jgi:hypothetical protein
MDGILWIILVYLYILRWFSILQALRNDAASRVFFPGNNDVPGVLLDMHFVNLTVVGQYLFLIVFSYRLNVP